MSFLSFITNPKSSVPNKVFMGIVGSFVALIALVGSVRIILAQQDDSAPNNAPPADQQQQGPGQGQQSPGPEQNQQPNQGQPGPGQNQEQGQNQMQPQQGQQGPGPSQGQDNGQGQQPGGQQGQGGQQGPGQSQGMSDEQRQQMEAQQKARDAQNFKQMQKNVKQTLSMLKRLATRIASMKKSGINVPSDLQASLDAAKKDVAIILNAKSMDDDGVSDAMDDLQDSGGALQDAMPNLEQLAQAASMAKQADSQIKRLNTSLARVQKIAKTSKIDVSAQADEFAQAVNDIKTALQKAKDALSNGDGETAMQTLQDEVFEKLQDAFQYETLVRALQNVRSNITRFNSFANSAQKIITKMQKAGSDVGDAPSQLGQMNSDLNDLRQLIAQKDFDPNDVTDLVNSLFDAQASIQDALGMPNSTPTFVANPNDIKDFQSFQNVSFPSNSMNAPLPGGQQNQQF